MSNFDEVRNLSNKVFNSGGGAPEDFAQLVRVLFSSTVLARGEAFDFWMGKCTNNVRTGTISGRNQNPLKLSNGYYLKFFMELSQEKNNPLAVTNSCYQYQTDYVSRYSKKVVFRYDYDTEEELPGHPTSHLQIYGALDQSEVLSKSLSDVRFPVDRPSIESVLSLLINDFNVTPNDKQWKEIVDHSEKAFRQYQSGRQTVSVS